MKFGIVTQIAPLERIYIVKISNFWKSKMAERKQQPTTEGETEVLWYIKWSVIHVHKFKRKKIKKQI